MDIYPPTPNHLSAHPLFLGQIDGIVCKSPNGIFYQIADDKGDSMEQAIVDLEDKKFPDSMYLQMVVIVNGDLHTLKQLVKRRREVLEGIPDWEAIAGVDLVDADVEAMKERIRQRLEFLDRVASELEPEINLKQMHDDMKKSYDDLDRAYEARGDIIEQQASFIKELVAARPNVIPVAAICLTVGFIAGALLTGWF